jgi:large repetitive protein
MGSYSATGITYGVAGAVGDGTTGIAVAAGTPGGPAVNTATIAAPSAYSTEVWFKTTSTTGGKLIGFADNSGGMSNAQDKHVYLTSDGQVRFGVWNDHTDVLSSPKSGYNDNRWHQVAATQGPTGMALYIDGALVASNTVITSQRFTGDWQVGGQINGGWPGLAAGAQYTGLLDEAAIYPSALTAAQVGAHYAAAHPA